MKTSRVLALASFVSIVAAAPAHALFMVDPDPGGQKFFIDIANKNVTSFSGTVGANNSGPVVDVSTVGNVDTGAGYANIKPASKTDTLTSLTFTPENPNLFADFSFRGQLEDGANGTVSLTVIDNQLHGPQTFTFTGLGGPNDFARVGIIAVPGSGETIQSVTITSNFKEVKQVDFSFVPEPRTYAMLGLGLALLGVVVRRRDVI